LTGIEEKCHKRGKGYEEDNKLYLVISLIITFEGLVFSVTDEIPNILSFDITGWKKAY